MARKKNHKRPLEGLNGCESAREIYFKNHESNVFHIPTKGAQIVDTKIRTISPKTTLYLASFFGLCAIPNSKNEMVEAFLRKKILLLGKSDESSGTRKPGNRSFFDDSTACKAIKQAKDSASTYSSLVLINDHGHLTKSHQEDVCHAARRLANNAERGGGGMLVLSSWMLKCGDDKRPQKAPF